MPTDDSEARRVAAEELVERWVLLRHGGNKEIAERDMARTKNGSSLAEEITTALTRAAQEAREEAMEEAVSLIPTNWLDSLLSGPQSALPSATAGRWGCPEIERLLTALADRLRVRAQETEHE